MRICFFMKVFSDFAASGIYISCAFCVANCLSHVSVLSIIQVLGDDLTEWNIHNGTISVKRKTDGSVRLDSLLEKHMVLRVLTLTRTCRVTVDGFLTQAILGKEMEDVIS
ncbi:hypothetical protein V8G54_024964 [Vigna mungo]|uniref:Uncharacterized protein n=1 Tax=Vigna mungo TaxID=3915 RepID=A0AAQ3RT37_VIGMU